MSNLEKQHVEELELDEEDENQDVEEKEEEDSNLVNCETKILKLKEKYFFHELLKESTTSKHYIVEDLELEIVNEEMGEENEDVFLYLKQTFYESKEEILEAKKYYIKLIKYCQSSFAKNDIIKYCDVLEFIDETNNYFELVVITSFGESERIDVENIEKDHINKFLKNVCLLLKDLKKYDNLYHSNISLNNIILDKEELKLSGFKPFFTGKKTKPNWKYDFIRKYGLDRLDLYLLGILWLRFLNTNVEEKVKEESDLDNVLINVKKIVEGLNDEQKMETVSLLLDLDNYEEISLDMVILNFDEHYILENIKTAKVEDETVVSKFTEKDNVFRKPLESENAFTLAGYFGEEKFTEKNNENFIKINGTNFTLQGEDDYFRQNNEIGFLELNQELTKKKEPEMRWSTDPNAERFTFAKKNIQSETKLNVIKGLTQNPPNDFNFGDDDYDPNYLSSKFNDKTLEIDDIEQNESNKDSLDIKDYENTKNNLNSKNNQDIQKEENKKIISEESTQHRETKNKLINAKNDSKKKINQDSNSQINNNRKQFEIEHKISKKPRVPVFSQSSSKNVFKKKPEVIDVKVLKQEEDKDDDDEENDEPQYVFGELVKKEEKVNPELEKAILEEIENKKREIEIRLQKEKDLIIKKDEERKKREEDLKKKIQKAIEKKKKQKEKRDVSPNIKIKEKNPSEIDTNFKNRNRSFEKHIVKVEEVENSNKKLTKPQSVRPKLQSGKSPLNLNSFQKKVKISDSSEKADLLELNSNSIDVKNKNIPFNQLIRKYKSNYQESTDKKIKSTIKRLNQRENNLIKKNNKNNFISIPPNQKKKLTDRNIINNVEEEDKSSDDGYFYGNKSENEQALVQEENDKHQNSNEQENQDYFVSDVEDNENDINKEYDLDNGKDLEVSYDDQKNDEKCLFENKDLSKKVIVNDQNNIIIQENISENKEKAYDANDVDLENLNKLLITSEGVDRLEILKKLSLIYFQKNELNKSTESIKECLDLLEKTLVKDKELKKQTLLLSLATIYIKDKKFEKALKPLERITLPEFESQDINTIKGDCYHNLQKYQEAFQNYIKDFNKYNEMKNMDKEDIDRLQIVLKKICYSLEKIKGVQLVKFFLHVLSNVNKIRENNDKKILLLFEENALLNLLGILVCENNYDLLNYFLNYIISKDLLKNDLLTESQNMLFVKVFLNFSIHLKSIVNYGNQKDSFLNFLNYSLKIIQKCEKNPVTKNEKILILIYRGSYYLEHNDLDKALGDFKDSFEISQSLETFDEKIFIILFNLGHILNIQNNKKEALYYYEQILVLNCEEKNLIKKTHKELLKLYYKLGLFERCVEKNKKWIFENLVQDYTIKKRFFYLSIFIICCYKTKSQELEEIIELVEEEMNENNFEDNFYLAVYHSICILNLENQNYAKNDKFLVCLQKLLNKQNDDHFPEKFLNMINLMYNKYNLNKYLEAFTINKELLCSFEESKNELDYDVTKLGNFLYNFVYLLFNKIPFEDNQDINYRNNIIEKIKQFKSENNIKDRVFNLLNVSKKITVNTSLTNDQNESRESSYLNNENNSYLLKHHDSINEKINDSLHKNKNKSIKIKNSDSANIKNNNNYNENNNEQEKEMGYKKESFSKDSNQKQKRLKKQKRFNSVEFIKISNLDIEEKCDCAKISKNKITFLVKRFMLEIQKEDGGDTIIEKYENLDNKIKTRKLIWDRYIYIKRLLNFYISFKNDVDKRKIYKLMESAIDSQQMCIHDFKNILIILENFKDDIYIQGFIFYLHQNHKNLSKIVFNNLFLRDFNKMFSNLKDKIFEDLNNDKMFLLDNCPFIHFLELPDINKKKIIIKKNFFNRLSFSLLNKLNYFELFSLYIEESVLHEFYLNYSFFSTMMELEKKEKSDFAILDDLLNNLKDIIREGKVEKIITDFYIYNMYILVNMIVLNEDSHPIAEKIIQILFLLEKKIKEKDLYHFSIVCSLIGNIFFKNRLFYPSIKTKSIAFENVKKLDNAEMIFPAHFKKIVPKKLMMDILSFIFANHLELLNIESAQKFLQKLISFKSVQDTDKIDKVLFQIVFHIKSENYLKGERLIKNLLIIIKESNIDQNQAVLYNTIIESIKIIIENEHANQSDILRQSQKLKKSIDTLCNNILK